MFKVLSIGGFKDWSVLTRSAKPQKLLHSLSDKERDRLEEQFAKWLLELLRAQAQQCIRTQRFPMAYAPLSPAWSAHKRQTGLHPGFWIASGTLVRTIEVWREVSTGKWVLGWKPETRAPNGQQVALIAAALEKGSATRPARPLFTLLSAKISKNVYRLLREFCKREHPEYLPLLPEP